MDARSAVPKPVNEPVLDYAPGSAERSRLEVRLAELSSERIDLPMTIGGQQRMGRGARIGAMSLVLTDVPAGATAIGVPAKIMETTDQLQPALFESAH